MPIKASDSRGCIEGDVSKADRNSLRDTDSQYTSKTSRSSRFPLSVSPSIFAGSQYQHQVLQPTNSVYSSANGYLPRSDHNGRSTPHNSVLAGDPVVQENAEAVPLLGPPRPSIVLSSSKSFFLSADKAGAMPGVDENIYHWKVLNLSRAKLKASSRTSALLSGFAMVAMVEIQIDEKVPTGLLITFSACTVLLIAVHMLALMISTCILPNVEAVANLPFQTNKTVFESPHMTMNAIVELAWGFSTVLGILLFLMEIAILCWVKFYSLNHLAAWTATGLLIPIMVIFIAFAAHFYRKLVGHKSEVYEDGIKELELLKDQLELENAAEEKMKSGGSPPDQPAASDVQIV